MFTLIFFMADNSSCLCRPTVVGVLIIALLQWLLLSGAGHFVESELLCHVAKPWLGGDLPDIRVTQLLANDVGLKGKKFTARGVKNDHLILFIPWNASSDSAKPKLHHRPLRRMNILSIPAYLKCFLHLFNQASCFTFTPWVVPKALCTC